MLNSEHKLTAQLGGARPIVCSLTYSDNDIAHDRLACALEVLASAPPAPDRPAAVVPSLEGLDLEQAMSPRDVPTRTEQAADPVGG